ncbi:MAG: phosphatase PAP2 family protein [Rickettsiaceae bacterium]|nr:phosphatase PAP2 family protein [Rickettsiaceae bacterium]
MLKIENWILVLRSESLNVFFAYFPLLASDYFYISLISIGYWIGSGRVNFLSLAFLVPYSTLLNCLLKNVFHIPRPDSELYLVPAHDPFGFPSGDVQVATVFWYYIFLNSRNLVKYLYFIPIIGIGISRIYLGVHSFNDVIFGFIVGIATIFIWINYLETQIWKEQYFKYWTVVIVTIAGFFFFSFSRGLSIPPMVSMSSGALIGLGILLPYFQGRLNYKMRIANALVYLFFVIIIFRLIPIIKTNALVLHISIAGKFVFVIVSIFYIVPKIDQIFFHNIGKNSNSL